MLNSPVWAQKTPSVSISIDKTRMLKDGGEAIVTVTLSKKSEKNKLASLSLNYDTNGTGSSGYDFNLSPSTYYYQFKKNETSFSFKVIGVYQEYGSSDVDLRITITGLQNCVASGAQEVRLNIVNELGAVYCSANGDQCDEFIDRVQLGSIDNANTGCSGGYDNFTGLSTNMTVGVGYPIAVTNGNNYDGDQCGIWVDWNQDGDFDDTDETISVAGGTTVYTANITPPVSAVAGNTRMRIRITWTGVLESCGVANWGEVEDYTINVVTLVPTIDLAKAFDETCAGNDGIIQFYETSPVIDSGLDFSIDAGANWHSSPVFTGLSAGSYNLRIRKAGGGTNSADYSITIGSAPNLTLATTVSDEDCGTGNGSIDLTVSGGRNGSLQTDGATGMVDLQSNFLSGLGTFTLEGWVKLNNAVATYTGQKSFFGQNDVIEFGFENGSLTCWTSANANVKYTLTNYPDDQNWHHVAVVGTGDRLILYIDGVQKTSSSHSFVSSYGNDTNYSAKIGAGVWDPGATSEPFDGVFADVRFWNDARTTTEIYNNKNLNINGNEQGLIAVYKMDVPPDAGKTYGIGPKASIGLINNGATWLDTDPVYVFDWTGPSAYSSNGEDLSGIAGGTYNLNVSDLNGCTVSTSVNVGASSGFVVDLSSGKSEICEGESETLTVNSPVDYSMSFDGSNDYLSTVNSSDINLRTVDLRTIMLRFKPQDIARRQVLYEEGGGTHGISIYIEGGKINVLGWVSRSAWSVVSANLSSTDTWYHYTFTWNASGVVNQRIKAYLNGNLVSQANGGAAVPAHSGDIRIGNAGNTLGSIGVGNPFNGSLDNFRIWNVELSQAEIQTEMSAKNAAKAGAVVDYDFDDSSDVAKVIDVTTGNDATVNNGAAYESDYAVIWDDPMNATTYSVDVSPLITTTYTATLTNENGCQTSGNVTVTVNPTPKPIGIFFE